jgi:hypothetical protein
MSSVQIWKDKQDLQLLYQSGKIKFEYQHSESCYYLEISDIVVLLTPCIHPKYADLLYVLFDFNKNVFATINAPDFKLKETGKNAVQLELNFRYSYDDNVKEKISQNNGKLIDLAKLKWHNLNKIDKACLLAE